MADERERFSRALDFMKMLGISHGVVAPLLRRLIKLYDNEWSLIEEENYRVLADSYFDQLESKETIMPTRVTRNAARRAASNESMPTEIQRKELTPVISKPNKQVAFLPTTSVIGTDHLNCVRYEEKPTQLGNNHATAANSRQNKAPILGICDSLAYNLQLECVSYQETRPNDSKVSYQGTRPDDSKIRYQEKRGNEQSAYIEKMHPKKPRIEAAASSPTIQKPVYDMVLVSSVPTAPLRVKEEPVELPCLVEKRNDIVLLDAASSSYSLPAAIVSTCQSGKKAVHKHEESMLKNGDFKGRKASPSKEQSRETSALIAYPNRNEAKQEKDALSRIAATYGNMSDDELEADGQDNDLAETNDSPFMKWTNAKTQRLESANSLILKGKGVKTVTHIRSTMVVKEEPKVLFFITQSQDDSYTHNPDDISRGQEIVPIKLAKDFLNQSLPTSFYYIPKNITFQDAYVNFSLARIGEDDCCGKCYGDCLKRYPSCHCARETGGEFAYNSEGRLREGLLAEAIADKRNAETSSTRMKYCEMGFCLLERGKNGLNREPCKGHLIRKFVKECWSKCGCGMNCGNRVVQKGIRQKLEVFFTSKGKGWGVRTLEDLPAGTFVCEYIGEILTNIELDTRNTARKGHSDHYPVLLDADWSSETMLKDEELLCLDATTYGNVARFINHRCYDANLVDIPVEIESPDHHYYHIAFFTTRLVMALEELTWDYSIDFEDLAHPIKAFHCLCESQYCRSRHYKA